MNKINYEEIIFNRNKKKIIEAIRSAENCSYYRNLFIKNNIDINKIHTYSDFKKIPILSKNDYKQNYLKFVKDGMLTEASSILLRSPVSDYSIKDKLLNPLNLEIYITSGSTGTPIEIIRHKYDVNQNYIVLNNYRKIVGGFESLSNYVWVLPESIASRKYVFCQESTYFRHNRYGYIACIEKLSKARLQEFLLFCYEKEIKSIIAWPSFLERLADYTVNTKQINLLQSVQYIESNSELLEKKVFFKICDFLKKPITNIYSGNETNFIAGTCSKNCMHVFDDNIFIELIRNQGGSSETIVTNLNSANTALIRYNLGDIAEWDSQECSCECNKKYPYKIKLINYRSNDMVLAKDGSKYEFNIIADPLNFSQIKYGIDIGKYKVEQVMEDCFILFYSNEISDEEIGKIVSYVQNYLHEVLEYEVDIKASRVNMDWNNYNYNRKYRYFECCVKK